MVSENIFEMVRTRRRSLNSAEGIRRRFTFEHARGKTIFVRREEIFMAGFLPFAFCLLAFAQDQGVRDITPEEFVKSRPARSTVSSGSARRGRYKLSGARPARPSKLSGAPKPDSSNATQLGLTIWRLRPSIAADSGARIIVHHEGETEEWTPERIESNTPLRIGERIRFSFESPQAGYLYVIDREQYAGGSTGDPYLIFPTSRTREGDNQVAPGRIIEIPSQDDRPNFFSLRRTRLDQTGELLTVIVAPQPIEGLAIGAKPLPLSSQQVAQWEKQWSASTEKFEMAGSAGKPWTRAEQEAGASGARRLTQDDPSPQTIYRVAVKPETYFLIKVELRYSRARTKTQSSQD
jgi:Domain of unknown function (DUF4384)